MKRLIFSFEDEAPPGPSQPQGPVTDVKVLARSYTLEATRTLAETMRDRNSPPTVRVSAANSLLARGWGSPESSATVTVKTDAREMSSDELVAIAAGALSEKALQISDEKPAQLH